MNESTPITRHAFSVTLLSLAMMALDQLSKYWMLHEVGLRDRSPITLSSNFSLVMVWNHGVSFGMFSRTGYDMAAYFLIAVAVIISAVLFRTAMKAAPFWERAAYAVIIGGALSNALDRVRFGAVADFLYVHIGNLGWPVFNVADSGICIGVFLLLLRMLRAPKLPA